MGGVKLGIIEEEVNQARRFQLCGKRLTPGWGKKMSKVFQEEEMIEGLLIIGMSSSYIILFIVQFSPCHIFTPTLSFLVGIFSTAISVCSLGPVLGWDVRKSARYPTTPSTE